MIVPLTPVVIGGLSSCKCFSVSTNLSNWIIYLRVCSCEMMQLRIYDSSSHRSLYKERTYKSRLDYQRKVKSTVNEMIATCALPPSAKNLVVTTPHTSRFYLLPKIHKPNNPGRPIVSACSCPTENISAYLDEVLAPFVQSLPTYAKDTNHALHIFDSFRFNTATPGHHFLSPWTSSHSTQ